MIPALIVIGASAGALDALTRILSPLPSTFPVPIVAVVHLPPDKKSALVEVLQMKCKIRVKEAEDKEPLTAGKVYTAPPDYHLLIEKDFYLSLSSDEPVLYSRPSINVLFETAADAGGSGVLGIVLTGANNDGAAGLKEIMFQGGAGLVQFPDTAYASAMPEAALEAAPNAKVMTLDGMADYLLKIGNE